MQHSRLINARPRSINESPKSQFGTSNTIAPRPRFMASNHASLTIGSNKIISKQNPKQHGRSDLVIDNSENGKASKAMPEKDQIPSEPFVETLPVTASLWFHEPRTSQEEIVIDQNIYPKGLRPGDIIEVQSVQHEGTNKKLVFKLSRANIKEHNEATDSPSSERSKLHTFQLSLQSNPFQKILDVAPRTAVYVKRVKDANELAIDSMEIFIKDVNMSRDAMWQYSSSLVSKCCHLDQRLQFLGSRIGIVKCIYKNGKRIFSGYVNEETKIIFRSESAKLTVLLQLSQEMWNFEENGEIMFHKLINNLFPKIFRRWREKGTHHSITIVLFTSIDLTNIPWLQLDPGQRPPKRRDYYRVVVDQVNILYWDRIMANLRLEFANFKRDILLSPERKEMDANKENDLGNNDNCNSNNNYVMQGQILPAVKGNILEALNVGLVLLNDRFRNTDLRHSLNHFILVTAGTSLFDVDYQLLLNTSRKISSIDTSLDIICLSQPPLHVTPLFRFNKEGKLCHCVPNWCDVSFFKGKQDDSTQWIPRCKIYELQMMGVMENEISEAKIPRYHFNMQLPHRSHLHYSSKHLPTPLPGSSSSSSSFSPRPHLDHDQQNSHNISKIMDNYDDNIFKPIKHTTENECQTNGSNGHEQTDEGVDESRLRVPAVKNSKATLSLIFNDRTSLLPVSGSATTSSATGMVAQTAAETSALTSLYNINKHSEDKPTTLSRSSTLSKNASMKDRGYDVNAATAGAPANSRVTTNASANASANTNKDLATSNGTGTGAVFEAKNLLVHRNSPRTIRNDILFSRKDSELLQLRRLHTSDLEFLQRTMTPVLVEEEPQSPFSMYWTDIENPSRAVTTDVMRRTPLNRWSNLFPENVRRKIIKWRSFQAPAALPIFTTSFPSQQQLQDEYTFQIYSVYLSPDNYLELKSTSDLMREMIQLRLLLGFQICYGERVRKAEMERKPSGNAECIFKYFPSSGDCLGARVYMSIDNEIHRIFCDYNDNLYVQLYRKIQEKDKHEQRNGISDNSSSSGNLNSNSDGNDNNYNNYNNKITLGMRQQQPYHPLIRTRYADEFTPAQIDALESLPQTYNWNQFDQYMAGFEEAMPESKKEFHKMKFVVLPTEIPKNAYFLSNEKLTAEEIRVEGLRKLISLIEKGKSSKSTNTKSDRGSEIIFYTGNLYEFLNNEAENYDITGTQPTLMIPENMRFTKSIGLSELALELQNQQTGLNLVDRNWHFKKHLQCFIGSELVTWLVDCFEDIDEREDAVVYGQSLLNKGLFKHVELRHGFIDGYYFYEFEPQYFEKREKLNRSSWLAKKEDPTTTGSNTSNVNTNTNNTAVASTKISASPKIQSQDGLGLGLTLILGLTKITSSQNLGSENTSLADSTGRKRRKFILGRSIKFDVDPLKRSFRPELITVHYDRVHNPEHCYHIRLQWLNTTNKFIEDNIAAWSRLCERHGLKLVETPWKELCSIPQISPFHSFVEVKLLLNPWEDPEFVDDKIFSVDRYYYHLYFLKKFDFLLDNRTSSFFLKDNIDIVYSWGKPTFQYAQFIHKTGFYIIELRDNGEFFLAPNNMHLIRVSSSSSPTGDHESAARAIHLDSQRIMMNFRAACQDTEGLRALFQDAKLSWTEQGNITQVD